MKRDPSINLERIERECDSLSPLIEKLRSFRAESGRYMEFNKLDKLLDFIWMILFETWAKVAAIEKPLYPLYIQLGNIYRELQDFKLRGI